MFCERSLRRELSMLLSSRKVRFAGALWYYIRLLLLIHSRFFEQLLRLSLVDNVDKCTLSSSAF
jgi:hypothetical protein